MNLSINSNINFVNFRKILTLALGFLLFEGVSAMQSSKPNSGLTERQRYIAMIAADTAAGDMEQLEKNLEKALSSPTITINDIKEILVQMYAYCGFPRSLSAINKFKAVLDRRKASGVQDEEGEAAKVLSKDTNRNKHGEEVRAKLTGQSPEEASTPAPYAQCVPIIDDFLKEHLFADIFSRGVLSDRDREIATVAALGVRDGVAAQRDAHIGIAKRQGVSQEQIKEILSIAYRPHVQFGLGNTNDGYAQYFKGQSYLKMIENGVANVTFEPGCRNNWHIHHGIKQVLLVTGGRGYYQEKGKEARELTKGDVVVVPSGVKHWHGAAADSWFTHLSVEVPVDDGSEKKSNEWCEPVSDEDYGKLK